MGRNEFMKWLPKFICNLFYHRFGYKSDFCVRCGVSLKKADGLIISSDYDNPSPLSGGECMKKDYYINKLIQYELKSTHRRLNASPPVWIAIIPIILFIIGFIYFSFFYDF